MNRGRIVWVAAPALALVLVLPGTAAAGESPPDSIPMPAATSLSFYYDAFDQSIARPITRTFDLSRLARSASGRRREAANVDALDRVRLPSTWWQPRVGYRPVSVSDMLAGPGPGPAPGPWTIVSAKSSGVSKGFVAKDSLGNRFAVKFDVPEWPELATGADVVASKLYWAAGYNAPDNAIVTFRREDLSIAAKATRPEGTKKVPLDAAYLDELLRGVPQQADGSYRVVASRYLPGKPLGEWLYEGRRLDDAEDGVPHELRREIRGLWAINAWLNHTDCSARNTLDMYVTDGGRSFVRHHLLDFSGCLGSASIAQQPMRSGHEYWVDFRTITASLVTLDVPAARWEASANPGLPGVGFIDSRTFNPGAWRPYLPNPAFDQRTRRDIVWGAGIVAAFSDEQIRAAVEQGRYSDPRATEYLVQVLIERRDKIARRWLGAGEAAARVDADARLEAGADAAVASAGGAPGEPLARPGIGARAGRAATNVLSDGWTIVASPFQARGPVLVWAGLAIGAGAALYANDQSIHDALVRNRRDPAVGGLIDVGTTIEPVGFMGRTNPYYLGALVSGYAFHVRVLRTVPTEILESHLLAGGVRNVGKVLVGPQHPYEDGGPYVFRFGHGTSFPSGHTSVAFELATIASMNAHALPVTIAAYALATSVAVQRVSSGNHWPSDVFFAAVYGTLVSRTVVKLHEARENGRPDGMTLVPRFADDGTPAGLQLTRRF